MWLGRVNDRNFSYERQLCSLLRLVGRSRIGRKFA